MDTILIGRPRLEGNITPPFLVPVSCRRVNKCVVSLRLLETLCAIQLKDGEIQGRFLSKQRFEGGIQKPVGCPALRSDTDDVKLHL